MNENKVPKVFRTKIRNKNLLTILIGLGLCYALYLFKGNSSKFLMNGIIPFNILNAIIPITIIITIFCLIIIPLYFILFRPDIKKSENLLKDIRANSDFILNDYKNAKPVKKIKVGKICSFYQNFYSYNVIPNSHIGWVYKKDKKITRKMVDKSRTGHTIRIRYILSITHKYSVILRLLDQRTIIIPCQKENSADKIVEYFEDKTNAIVGFTAANQKAFGKRVSAYKKRFR